MISIQKYNNKMLHLWDDFISNSNNGTIFNTQKFLNYHIDRDFSNHSLLFFKKKRLIAVLPAVLKNKNILFSHPGASFGGLILIKNLKFSDVDNVVRSLIAYCKKIYILELILINTPMIYYHHKDDSLNYLLLLNNFTICENYISHYINIAHKENLINLLNKRKKRYLKQLIDDNRFDFYNKDSLKAFYSILVESKKTFNAKPTHSLKELERLQSFFPKQVELLISKYENKIAGGSLIFYTNNKSCLIFYNVVKEKYRNSQLASLQLYKCIQFAKKRNCDIVDLGVSHAPEKANPLNPKKTLIHFKEQLGGRGIMRTVYKRKFDEK